MTTNYVSLPFLLLVVVLLPGVLQALQIQDTVSNTDSRKSTQHKRQDSPTWPAHVTVDGDPHLHDNLVLHVHLPHLQHHVTVERVQHDMLDERTQSFLVDGHDLGKPTLTFEPLPSLLRQHSRQFFCDESSGTIVSVVHGPGGEAHVEGLLHDLVIAPPGSHARHKRDLHRSAHSVWRHDDDDDEAEGHSGDDGEHPDYLEVPSIFQDRRNWKVIDDDDEVKTMRGARDYSRRRVARQADFVQPNLARQFTPLTTSLGQQNMTVDVMLLLDTKMYEEFHENITEAGLFLLHFWQAVNFKFRTLKSPDIQVRILVFGAFKQREFQAFLEKNRVSRQTGLVSLLGALNGFQEWIAQYERQNRPLHDAAFLHTGEDLCTETLNTCDSKTSGIGYVKGACISRNLFPEYTFDVAVTEIGRSLQGVLVATHELGHLLGAYHDGTVLTSDCPESEGFVMSYTRTNAYNFTRFSHCSRKAINEFVTGTWYSRCLKESPDSGYSFPTNTLPGDYMTIEEQCRYYNEGVPCPAQPMAERCEKLCCETSFMRVRRREPAADGTPCGFATVCLNGECVPRWQVTNL